MSLVNQLATHLPDEVVYTDHSRQPAYVITQDGVLMFADVSGFTSLCEKYSMNAKNGTDQLTKTLNSYMGSIVECIINSDGDVMKYAGDAILATWPVKTYRDLASAIVRVVKCALTIQAKCGEYMTDVGVKLKVKLGIAAGQFSIIFMGNDKYRHYVTVGRAVNDVNKAETFCESGFVVVSPNTWMMCPQHENILYETMSDNEHVRVVDVFSIQSSYKIGHTLTVKEGTEVLKRAVDGGNVAKSSSKESAEVSPDNATLNKKLSSASAKKAIGDEMAFLKSKSRGSRVRKAIFVNTEHTQTSPNLNQKLRLYIAEPVLRKMDAGQPLEYLSEMRQVTIVFMNMALEVMSRQEQCQLVQTAYLCVNRHLKPMHGCLNKVFMFDKGCTFLAIFGLPGFKHENDCAHALQCSFRMKSELDKVPQIVHTSIGVTTGSTFCGVVGHKHRHEYTVIGRKVNMAARLMMYYPNMVTCDNETFHHARLGKTCFRILEDKALKGLQNIGSIREYIEKAKNASGNLEALILQEIQYPLLVNCYERLNVIFKGSRREPFIGREKEMSQFYAELNTVKANYAAGWQRRTIIFEGESGSGKSRMLESVILKSLQEKIRVISCTMTLHDSRVPFFAVCSLVMQLLELDFEQTHQEREHRLLTNIKDRSILDNLFLLNDLLQIKLPANENYQVPHDRKGSLYPGTDKIKMVQGERRSEALHALLYRIVHEVTCKFGNIIFAVDDAHLMDAESWEFIADLGNHAHSLCVLAMRIQQMVTVNATAMKILTDPHTMIIKLGGLADRFVAPLVCQLLDVMAIPSQLERLLRRKAHGLPSWCEQILRQLYHDKVIDIVAADNLTGNNNLAMIEPDRALIGASKTDLSTSEAVKAALRDMPGGVSTEVQDMVEQCGETDEDELSPASRPSMVCIIGNGKSLDNIGLPDSMRGMIQTQIDRMTETEQMVVKCAAVIGMIFPRGMLEFILPVNDPPKLKLALKKLMDTEILACASGGNSSGAIENRTFGARAVCKCPSRSGGKSNSVTECQLLKFLSASMRETAHAMFVQKARKELHIKAAHYLEELAHKCPACGGGDFIPGHHLGPAESRKDKEEPSASSQSKAKRRSISRKRGSVFGPKQKFAKTFKRERRVSIDSGGHASEIERQQFKQSFQKVMTQAKFTSKVGASKESGNDLLLESLDSQEALSVQSSVSPALDMRSCECMSILSRVYPQLVLHWRAAGNVSRTIHFLAESGAAAIGLSNNMQALSFLNEALEIIDSIKSGNNPFEGETNELDDKKIEKEEQARIHSLIGQATFHMGDTDDSLPHFHKALRKLSNRQPTSSLGIKLKTLKEVTVQRFHRAFPSHYIGSARGSISKTNHLIEQSRCLSHMFDYFINSYKCTHAFMVALQQVNRAESADSDLHELLMAYTCMIQIYVLMKNIRLASVYEKLAIRRCLSALDKMAADDTVTIAHLYCVSLNFRLSEGKSIISAIESGFAAYAFTEKLHDNDLKLQMMPILAQTLLLNNRICQCVEVLENMKYTCEEVDDSMAVSWYYFGCLDLIMEAGFQLEPFSKCVIYTQKALLDPIFETNNLSIFLLTASLALCYARKHLWAESDKWYGFAKSKLPTKTDSYSSVYGLSKLLELQLLTYYNALAKKEGNAIAIMKECKAKLQEMEAACSQLPVLTPRFMHLSAYMLALEKKMPSSKQLLQTCIEACKKAGNVMEEQWAVHSKQVWFSPNHQEKNLFWREHAGDSQSSLDWHMANQVEGSVIKFSLPLP